MPIRFVAIPSNMTVVFVDKRMSYVVVSFAKRNESCEHMVSGRVPVVERLVAKPMGK